MTKAFFVLTVLASAVVGCGGDECDEQVDRIHDYIESCDGAVPALAETKEECTAEYQKLLTQTADAFVKSNCDEVRKNYPKN